MSRLLSAGFYRLFRSWEFWTAVFFVTFISLYVVFEGILQLSIHQSLDHIFHFEDRIFSIGPAITFILAVFISLYTGTDYSDKTIRNKLIAGYKPYQIYLANWLICVFCSLLFVIIWLGIDMSAFYLIEGQTFSIPDPFNYFVLTLIMIVGYSSVFTLAGMLCSSRTGTVIINILLWIALMIAASMLIDRLTQPEFWGGMAYINGEFVLMDETPNPYYLSGTMRSIYQWLYTLLPSGIMVRLDRLELFTPWIDAVCGIFFSLVTTLAGMFFFSKKETK